MATADVSISESVWTLVAAESTSVYMSVKGSFPITFQVQASLPAANSTVGHPIPKEGIKLELGAGENVYAKSSKFASIVTVTTFA